MHGWNTWQLLWKDIWKVANNSDLLDQGSNSSVQSVHCADPAVEPQVYQISAPESCVSNTVLDGQSILALCCTSQSIPRMTSMSDLGKTISEAGKLHP